MSQPNDSQPVGWSWFHPAKQLDKLIDDSDECDIKQILQQTPTSVPCQRLTIRCSLNATPFSRLDQTGEKSQMAKTYKMDSDPVKQDAERCARVNQVYISGSMVLCCTTLMRFIKSIISSIE